MLKEFLRNIYISVLIENLRHIKFLAICNSILILLEIWVLQGCECASLIDKAAIVTNIGSDIPAIPNYEPLIEQIHKEVER